MLRRCLFLVALLGTSCTSVRSFEMRWEVLSGAGECSGAGINPAYSSQTRVKLRYVKAPNHFKV